MHSSQVSSHRKIRAIIFDMDNTLFDFVAAKQHACQEVAKFLGRDDWEALFFCFLNSPHGFESHENIKDYFDLCGLLEECSTRQTLGAQSEGRIHLPGGCSTSREACSTPPSSKEANRKVRDNLLADKSPYCNEVFARCCAIYEAEKVQVLSPYPGARETLAELRRRGFPLAVLTDAHNGNALARLRKTDLFQYFDHVISFDMTGAKKPAPDAFLLALKLLQTLPSETLLVGDSLRRDIAPAQALGMITAYAAYGDRNVRARDPPDCRPDYVLGSIEELVRLVK